MIATAQTTILIVEDDLGIAELEKDRLEEAGHRAMLATDTDEAIRLVQENDIDLILLDYRLPGSEDGLQFFQRIRDAGYDIPVILVTGFSNEATVIRALRAGVRDFVTKSVEYLDYLPEAVGRVLHQVNTEHKLAESQARLGNIIRSARDAIIVADEDRRITLFNPAAEQMFDCPADDAIGRQIDEFLPPETPKAVPLDDEQTWSESLQFTVGNRGLRSNGEQFPIEASVSYGEAGDRRFYAVVIRDITERRRAEERIREQAALLDQASDAIKVHDLDHRITYWNSGSERLYGWTAAEAMGRSVFDLFGRNSIREQKDAQQHVLKIGAWIGELRQVTKDGREILVHSRRTLLRNDDGTPKGELVINTDVTEKRKLEAELLHAKRMESVGLLASGVAHDFNNLLTVICGYSELLQTQSLAAADAQSFLKEIQKAGERASSLTRQLLAFGRKQILSLQILNINDLVTDLDKMLRRLLGANIDLGESLDPSLGQVRADPMQIEQVVLNLVVNARDAIPSGGKITIETSNVELHESYASRHVDLKPGWYVMLAVSDTGCGMDEATKARIFEPFFTTKEVGKGTGLGLATVHGIVKQSGGHIEVYTELGHGSSFKVYLPMVNAEQAVAASAATPAAARGTETVLVAEDDEHVRRLALVALASNGYRVLEATDGEKGIQLAKEYREPIDVLLTDLVMPRMNGREMAEQISRTRPNLKVLFTSGYTDDAVVRHGILQDGIAFLQKPFTPGALTRKVREVLDAVPSPVK